jgi:hypothetical protein
MKWYLQDFVGPVLGIAMSLNSVVGTDVISLQKLQNGEKEKQDPIPLKQSTDLFAETH